MTNQEIFQAVVERLKADPFFYGFKFRKRDFTFSRQKNNVRWSIELEHWSKDGLLVVYPIYMVRFDILLKWFEPYSFKSLQDQRDNPSVAYSGDMLGCHNEFAITENNFEHEYSALRDVVVKCSDIVFPSYTSLRDLFDHEIAPILEGKHELPDVGADWVFKYLTLTRIVSPENYPLVKDLVMSQVHKMAERHEPNITEYIPQIDEIIKAMETRFPNA